MKYGEEIEKKWAGKDSQGDLKLEQRPKESEGCVLLGKKVTGKGLQGQGPLSVVGLFENSLQASVVGGQ